MSESETESEQTGEHAAKRTGQMEECQRCGREQGLVGKYDIWLSRQAFRELAHDMGFRKYE